MYVKRLVLCVPRSTGTEICPLIHIIYTYCIYVHQLRFRLNKHSRLAVGKAEEYQKLKVPCLKCRTAQQGLSFWSLKFVQKCSKLKVTGLRWTFVRSGGCMWLQIPLVGLVLVSPIDDPGPSAKRSIESLGTSNDGLQGIVAAAFGWSRTSSGGNSWGAELRAWRCGNGPMMPNGFF